MNTVTLTRFESTDEGTFGRLMFNDSLVAWTGELPWRSNQHGVSCIPSGEYVAKLFESPRFGRMLYRLEDVPERDSILIHPANWMGDAASGKKCQLNGCIALGKSIGTLDGQKATTSSQAAIAEFMLSMAGQPFTLKIGGLF